MRVPISAESALIPMEADDIPSLQEQRRKRDHYWAMLYNARQEFLKLTEQASAEYDIDPGAFYYYLTQNYGLQVETVDGKITGDYVVVNEQKYLIFLMKFGS
jgi:hypothetical protein